MSTGQRNNNPLNVKAILSGTKWKGQVDKDSRGHAIFQGVEYGWRAAVSLLRTYHKKYGLTTIRGIISRWAPATDTIGSIPGAPQNSPSAYAKFVARHMGIQADDDLHLFDSSGRVEDHEALVALCEAMSIYENGHSFRVSLPELEAGIRLADPTSPASSQPPPKRPKQPTPAPAEPAGPSKWTRFKNWAARNLRPRPKHRRGRGR